ncbi:MAG: signal peptidase I [Marinilabiliaceae bacterium]|nr:signal peptidase I [Marinilabiliaceae bacterium]
MQKFKIKYVISIAIVVTLLIWIKQWLIIILLISISLFLFYKKRYKYFITKYISLNRFLQLSLEWILIVSVSTLFVVFIKNYVFDIFRLPSSSMANTVRNGDLIFINKLIMGPRLKQNNINCYSRAKGLSMPKHNDLIVFNFPEGDTLLMNNPQQSYYALKRRFNNSKSVSQQFWNEKQYKKVNRRPQYIKRLIGLPGDTIQINDGIIYVNNEKVKPISQAILKYVSTHQNPDSILKYHNCIPFNQYYYKNNKIYEFESQTISQTPVLSRNFKPFTLPHNLPDPNIFPFVFYWNSDNIGPIVIPKQNTTAQLSIENIVLYERIIKIYEENSLEIINNTILINNKKTSSYTFKMNYYWVLGDNRAHSYDSRYWGFLPENHVLGISRTHINMNN